MTTPAPTRLRWIVRFPDGRETSFPLRPGKQVIGSAPEADIRLEDPAVAARQAELEVTPDGLRLVDLEGAGRVLLGGVAAANPTAVGEGDAVRVGPLVMHLAPAPVGRAAVPPPVPEIPTDPHALARDLGRGGAGYRRFQRRMAARVSPDEARTAERAHRAGMRATFLAFAGLILLKFLAAVLVPPAAFGAAEITEDVIESALFLAMLVLGSWYHARFAGRFLLSTAGVLAVFEDVPDFFWNGWDGAAYVLLAVGLMFGLGALFDYGISTREGRSRPQWRRACLTLFAAIWLALWSWLVWTEPYAADPGFGLVAILGLSAVWGWFPGMWIERHRPRLGPDATVVLEGATRRWVRVAAGRALAVAVVVFPFFLLLNILGVRERLQWPGEGGAGDSRPMRSRLGDREVVWFWEMKGRLLRTDDLEAHRIHGASHLDFASAEAFLDHVRRELEVSSPSGEAAAAVGELVAGNAGGRLLEPEAFAALERVLAPHRLTDAEGFNALWRDESAGTWRVLLLLACERTRPSLTHPEGREICYIQSPLMIRPFDQTWMARLSRQQLILAIPLVGYGLVAFVFLWRRGGDSALARWTGLWFATATSGALVQYSGFYLPAVEYGLWSAAVDSPVGAFLLGLECAVESVWWMTSRLSYVALPLYALWVHACWPTRMQDYAKPRTARLATAGKILAVNLAAFVAAFGVSLLGVLATGVSGDLAPPGPKEVILPPAGHLVVLGIMIAAGGLMRRRRRFDSEVPVLGPLPVAAWAISSLGLACVGSALGAADATGRLAKGVVGSPALIDGMFWTGIMLTLVAIVLAGTLVARRNFLRVAGVRDLSSIVLVAVLPFVFETANSLATQVLERTPFFSRQGAELLGILCTILLLTPIWRGIRQVVEWLLTPRLRQAQAAVEAALERTVGADASAQQAEVARVFDGLGVSRYAFYARGGGGDFRAWACRMEPPPPEALTLSDYLRAFLGRRRQYVDLEAVAHEWPFYFQQFELHHLQEAGKWRYLLPVCLGRSVRGLLFLPAAAEAQAACREAMGRQLNHLWLGTNGAAATGAAEASAGGSTRPGADP